jgi:beta-phosphoglucomutase-like phosphatase (HAD superfamily)
MLRYTDFAGVIFDVDDTLLDNMPRDPVRRLHERSRLAAVHEAGQRHGILALEQFSAEDNLNAFLTASVHTLEAAVWNILFMTGQVATNEIDPNNQLFREIVQRKEDLHEKILREEGNEVPGASQFVKSLAEHGLKGKMAVASTALRRDIDIFFEKTSLTPLFSDKRIISKDKVTHAKPHPEAFELAFATLGLPAELKPKVAVFEDDPRGIMAAKAAGMYVFAITTCFDKEHLLAQLIKPDVVADSFAEFAQLIGLPLPA